MSDILEIVVKLNDQASKKSKGISKSLGSIGSKAIEAGGILTGGLTVPIVGLGLKAVSAASDLNESMSKANTVFKDAAGPVLQFAKTSDTSYGIAKSAALDYAGTFGNLMTSYGVTQKTAAKYSTGLLALASDQASFNNTSPEEALTAVQSALTGEFEPMKRYGVALNVNAIKQEAVKEGLIKRGGALTDAARVQATYNLLMDRSSTVTGDFGRTSGGLANSQRIVTAQVEDLLATLGTQFLPIAIQVITQVKQLLTSFMNLNPEQRKMVVIVAAIAAAIGPFLVIIGTLITSIGAIIPVISAVLAVLTGPVLLVIAAVIAAVALLAYAWSTNWGDIRGKTNAAITFIKTTIQNALKLILGWWNSHKTQILNTIKILWATVQNYFKIGANFVLSLLSSLFGLAKSWWKQNGNAVISLVKNLWTVVKAAFKVGKSIVLGIVKLLTTGVTNLWNTHGKRVKALVSALWSAIKDIVNGITSIIGDIIRGFNAAIEGDWRGFGEALRSIWDDAWNTIKSVVTGLGGAVVKIIEGYVSDIKNAFSNTDWGALGRNIVDGVVSGVQNAGSALFSALKSLAKNALDVAKGALGINSPSKKFMVVGKNVVEGFVKGVNDTSKDTKGPMGKLQPAMNTNIYLTANYPYQSPKNVRSDVKRLNALYGGGSA